MSNQSGAERKPEVRLAGGSNNPPQVPETTLAAKADRRSQPRQAVAIADFHQRGAKFLIGDLARPEHGVVGVQNHGPYPNPVCYLRAGWWVLANGPDIEPYGMRSREDVEKWVYDHPEESDRRYLGEMLGAMEQGRLPSYYTRGAEIEGTVYSRCLQLLHLLDPHDRHPELIVGMIEDATEPHLRMDDFARDLGKTVLRVYQRFPELAYYSLTSVIEVGDLKAFEVNPHPYLQLMAPRVEAGINRDQPDVRTQAVLDPVSRAYGTTARELVDKKGIALWANQAFHTHLGVPGLKRDPDRKNGEVAMRTLNLFYTPAWKVVALMTSSSTALAGVEIGGVRDVRTSLRYLLPTTNGRSFPPYQDSLQPWIDSYVMGRIHSPARWPPDAQHAEGRPRPELGVTENTGTAQHPHLGVNLAVVGGHGLVGTIATESFVTDDDVYDYAKGTYGDPWGDHGLQVLRKMEAEFDRGGWSGVVELGGRLWTLGEIACQTMRAFVSLGDRYPALQQEAGTASAYLAGSVTSAGGDHVGRYFHPQEGGLGILTDIRRQSGLSLGEIIKLQAEETKKQAELLITDPDQLLNPPHLLALVKEML